MLFLELLARRQGTQVPPPTNLQAAPSGTSGVNLTWTNANGTLQTDVWRDGVFLITRGAGLTSYLDTGYASGVEYSYQVRHRASASSFSSFSTAVLESVIPPAPNLAVPAVTEDDVALSWSAVATATEYRVYRSTSSGSGYVLVHTTASLAWTDLARPNGTYYYIVRAFNAVNESANSNERSAVVAFSPPLDPPTGFTATASHSDRVVLNWTDGAAHTVEIYRGLSPNPVTLIDTVAAGVQTYADPNLTEGTTYYYRIRHNGSPSFSSYVSDSETLAVASLTDLSLTASDVTEQIVLAYTILNPPFAPTVDVGAWSDTDGVVSVAARTNVGPSAILIATYTDIVPIPTGTTVTGTLAHVRLRNNGFTLLDEVTNLTVDFDYGGA